MIKLEQPQQSQPISQETKVVNQKYEIHDDGTVTIDETFRYITKLEGRDFISFVRGKIQQRDEIKRNLSDEEIKRLQAELEKSEKHLEVLKPKVAEAEELLKKLHETKLFESKVLSIKQHLKEGKQHNIDVVGAIWNHCKEEEKKEILDKLDQDQQKKLLRIKAKEKR